MVYACGCGAVGRTNHLTTFAEMKLFWLPMWKMNYNGDPFTRICEWKRHFPSSRSSNSILWTLVVATMVSGSASIIYVPFSFTFVKF